MTSRVAIRAEGVSKRYFRGASPASQGPSRWLARLTAPARRAGAVLRGRLADASDVAFWALEDISFSVRPGEILGLVGRNGAGKTTLLRLLSGITRPTLGRIGIRGRVGSLLEVSIGFHPNLTGRENIFLYGAMLGLRRAEVAARLDEIVAYAEVAPLLYTPMRFYSTGMYARLAFAVASVLAPDILLVDEVLSVSDAGFQRRSLETIAQRAREGGTVLFVSHNLDAVAALCTRCLRIEQGRLVDEGATAEVLSRFRSHMAPSDENPE